MADEPAPKQASSSGHKDPEWRLLTAFWQGRPTAQVIELARAGGGPMHPEAQRRLMRTCLGHPITAAFPLNRRYVTRVLKQAAAAAEADGEECDDGLVEALCSRLGGPDGASARDGWGHKVFAYSPTAAGEGCGRELAEGCVSGRLQAPAGTGRSGLVVLNLAENMFEGSTGCHEWEAGFLLAEAVLSNPQLFRGRRCLELGCGAGVVGVCLSRAGAAAVACTDGDEDTVDNCRRNLEANGAGRSCRCFRLQWEDGWAALQKGAAEPPDVIVGADLLYDPDVIPALVALLSGMASAPEEPGAAGRAAYIATTLRNESTLEAFVAAVQASHELDIQDVTDAVAGPSPAAVRFQHLDGPGGLLSDRARVWVHRIAPAKAQS